MRQQLINAKTSMKHKLQEGVDEPNCRICFNGQEKVLHTLCGCSQMTQTLYKDRYDKMLTSLYHSLLGKYELAESQSSQPWYKQSHPVPCLENDKSKVLWDIPWHLERCPRNGANKPDISALDKVNKEWFIIEGTICMPGTLSARTMFKRQICRFEFKSVEFISGTQSYNYRSCVWFSLAAYSINLGKELANIDSER